MKITLPSFPLSGGCVCGAIRYAISAAPLSVYACHCKDCQRSASGPFSVALTVRREHFAVTRGVGKAQLYLKTAASGRQVPQFSCPVCATRLWNEPSHSPDMIILRAETLDDAGWAMPVGHIWTASRLSWDKSELVGPLFEGQPGNRQPLYDAWAAAIAP